MNKDGDDWAYKVKSFDFEESECDEILKTFNKVLNCTGCPDWSPKMVKKMPEFKFNLANTNGSSVNLELIDFITKGGHSNCRLNIKFILDEKETYF